MRVGLLATLCSSAVAQNSTCGYQCVADSDCLGCGSAGKCSKASEEYPAIASSCVDAPENPPSKPIASVADSLWPSQFTCDIETWTYADWTDTPAVAKGKLYYDGIGGRTKEEWSPYVDGKTATQVWVPSFDASGKSKYYVKSGALCIYFPITDTDNVSPINALKRDWMINADKLGTVKYMGREMVRGEWTDHYVATYNTLDGPDEDPHNQTIVFANWHSLGLGETPKGLPLRLTGGNINPEGQKGQPRLNTVWYSNFNVGPESVSDADFKKPGSICIPVGVRELVSVFGTAEVTSAQLGQPGFSQRARYLPHVAPDRADLQRARSKVPREAKSGQTFQEAMARLNDVLVRDLELSSRHCEDFSVEQLHEIQQQLFTARSPALQDVYSGHDNRALRVATFAELLASQEEQRAAASQSRLSSMVRDGLCHELVMLYVHHLTESARSELKSGAFVLPRLPRGEMHLQPQERDATATSAHRDYLERVSCTVCHIGANATISETAIAV